MKEWKKDAGARQGGSQPSPSMGFSMPSTLTWSEIQQAVKFVLISHGLKTDSVEWVPAHAPKTAKREVHYVVPKADLYLDCRGLLDGHVTPGFEKATGDDPLLQDAVYKANPATITSFQRIIEEAVLKIPARRTGEQEPFKRPFVVCFFCAHGVHRSRSGKNILGSLLKKAGYKVEVK